MTAEAAFDALGNPVRRHIMSLLQRGPMSVTDVAAALPVSRPAVSKHLHVLQSADLVTHDKVGTRAMFRLHPVGFDAARDWLDGFWDDALRRFQLVAENTSTTTSKEAE